LLAMKTMFSRRSSIISTFLAIPLVPIYEVSHT
jgi:hypothetical protein